MADQDISSHIVSACIASIVISTVAIVLRFWSRIISKTVSFWWDDYFSALAWALGIANCTLSIYWIHVGLGRHMPVVLSEGITTAQILLPVFIQDILYNTGISMVKLSALCVYARIFKVLPRFRAALWVGTGLVVAWWITFTVLAICTCDPVRKQWNPDIPGHCLPEFKTFVAAATPNVAIDLYILLLPMPVVWLLQMELRRRITSLIVIAMGYSVMIISITRLVTVVEFQKAGIEDFTWTWVEGQILVILEIPFGVFCICLPPALALAKRVKEDGWRALLRTGSFETSGLTSFSPPTAMEEKVSVPRPNSDNDSGRNRLAVQINQSASKDEISVVPSHETRVDAGMSSSAWQAV